MEVNNLAPSKAGNIKVSTRSVTVDIVLGDVSGVYVV